MMVFASELCLQLSRIGILTASVSKTAGQWYYLCYSLRL